MARCGCSGSCSCQIITDGSGVTVDGVGSPENPYRIGLDSDAIQTAEFAGGDARYLSSPTGNTTSLVVDRPSGVIEGVPLYAYGNSYLGSNGNALQTYFDRLKQRIGSQSWFNGGNNGMLAADACSYAFGTFAAFRQAANAYSALQTSGAGTWTNIPFPGGVAVIDLVRNDAGLDGTTTSGGTTAKSRAGFTNALDALIRLMRAASRAESGALGTAAFTSGSPVASITNTTGIAVGQQVVAAGIIPANTYVGTIIANTSFRLSSSPTTQVDVNATATNAAAAVQFGGSNTYGANWTMALLTTSASGASAAFTTTNNAQVTIPVVVTGQPTAVSLITFAIDDSANGVAGATYSVTVDGGAAITGTTSNQMRKTAHTPPNNAFCQMAIPLGTLSVGTHSVVLKHTGTTGQQLWFDCVLQESPTPLTVLVMKGAQLPAAGYTLTATYAAAGASWAKDQIYNGLVDTVVNRFPNDQSVISLDPNVGGWVPAQMIGSYSDGAQVHLNDRGNRFYADKIMAKLNSLSARMGLVKI